MSAIPLIVRHLLCWSLLLLTACEGKDDGPPPALRSVAPVPANPDLIPAGRELLSLLSKNYGKHTLAGQVDYKDEGAYVAVDYVASVTGKRPVIVGLDLMEYSPSRLQYGADPQNLIADAIDKVQNQKMVLALAWHWNAPMHLVNDDKEPWWRGFYTSATEFNLRAALARRESAEFAALLRDIDAIATQLKLLADADIPVLWRPLHEAEGRWFWWGAKGPEPFKELWRLMFVRLTDHHKLNNLIWVLTSEDPEWYPGDDVVDIVGVDAYPSDRSSILLENWSPLLKRHNGRKMIALTEFGGVPYVEEMQLAGVWFSFFISWTDQYRSKLGPMSVDPAHLQKVYQSPGVITLDEWTEIRNPQQAPPSGPAAGQ